MFRGLQEFSFWLLKTSLTKKPLPPYKHIVQLGDPVLRKQADPIPQALISSHEVKKIIKNLKDVMENYESVGLSAPQIGISKRIIAMEINAKHKKKFDAIFIERQMQLFPRTVIINPVLKITNYKKIVYEEGCESLRGYAADVPRYQAVNVTGYSENGDKVNYNFSGWLARIAQHEIDHLEGKVFTDIMLNETFHCCFWKDLNDYRGKVTLTFIP